MFKGKKGPKLEFLAEELKGEGRGVETIKCSVGGELIFFGTIH